MFGGELTEALGLADGDLAGDAVGAQRLGHLKTIVHHIVAVGVDAIVLDNLDENAGVFVFLAESLERIHRLGKAPLLDGVGGGALFGLLFRRRGLPVAARPTVPAP